MIQKDRIRASVRKMRRRRIIMRAKVEQQNKNIFPNVTPLPTNWQDYQNQAI